MRSTIISKWSSPIPLITVSPVSASDWILKVGSSSERRFNAIPIFSWSALVFVSEIVRSLRILQAYGGGNFSGENLFHLFSLVRLEAHDSAQALFGLRGRIIDISAALNGTGVHAEEGELANEGICLKLEGKCREWLLVRGVAHYLLARPRISALDRRNVEGARQVINDGVEHKLNALVLQSRASHNGENFVLYHRFSHYPLQIFERSFFALKIRVHHYFVVLDDALDQFGTVLYRVGFDIFWDLLLDNLIAHLAFEVEGLHFEKINHPFVMIFFADGNLHAHGLLRKAVQN